MVEVCSLCSHALVHHTLRGECTFRLDKVKLCQCKSYTPKVNNPSIAHETEFIESDMIQSQPGVQIHCDLCGNFIDAYVHRYDNLRRCKSCDDSLQKEEDHPLAFDVKWCAECHHRANRHYFSSTGKTYCQMCSCRTVAFNLIEKIPNMQTAMDDVCGSCKHAWHLHRINYDESRYWCTQCKDQMCYNGGVMVVREEIDHPMHYGGDTIYEAIKVIEAWSLNFNLGNVLKYIRRAGNKDKSDALEDLQKAVWYLNREIEQRGRAEPKAGSN